MNESSTLKSRFRSHSTEGIRHEKVRDVRGFDERGKFWVH